MKIKFINGVESVIFDLPESHDGIIGEFHLLSGKYLFVVIKDQNPAFTSENLELIKEHLDKLNRGI